MSFLIFVIFFSHFDFKENLVDNYVTKNPYLYRKHKTNEQDDPYWQAAEDNNASRVIIKSHGPPSSDEENNAIALQNTGISMSPLSFPTAGRQYCFRRTDSASSDDDGRSRCAISSNPVVAARRRIVKVLPSRTRVTRIGVLFRLSVYNFLGHASSRKPEYRSFNSVNSARIAIVAPRPNALSYSTRDGFRRSL